MSFEKVVFPFDIGKDERDKGKKSIPRKANPPVQIPPRVVEGNAKYRHLNKLTCQGTLRKVFICR
jgi:hypothetical protein